MNLILERSDAQYGFNLAETILDVLHQLTMCPAICAKLSDEIHADIKHFLEIRQKNQDKLAVLNCKSTYYEKIEKLLQDYNIDINSWYEDNSSVPMKYKEEAVDENKIVEYTLEILIKNRNKFYDAVNQERKNYPDKDDIMSVIEIMRSRLFNINQQRQCEKDKE